MSLLLLVAETIRDHSFSTDPKFSKKIISLIGTRTRASTDQGGRKCRFFICKKCMIPKMKIRRLFEPLISTIYAFLPRNNAEMQIELLHRQGTIVKGTTEKYCFYDYSWVKYSNNLANS